MITIAVDCMGGDVGPAVTLPACDAFLSSHPQAQLLLVGRPESFAAWPQVLSNVRCRVVPAAEVVEMDDAPRDSPSAREWASSPMTVLIAAVLPDPTRGDDPTRRYLPELGSSQS